jgi:hypothetical protein
VFILGYLEGTELFNLFRLDIAVCVGWFIFVGLIPSQAFPERSYTPSELAGDFADASRPKEKQDDDQNYDPFSATW